jgi:hypothetical protein
MDISKVRYVCDAGYGLDGRVEIDGVAVPQVRAVTFTSDVQHHNLARLELVGLALDVTFSAAVEVGITAYPGYDLIATPQPDGSTRYTVVDKGAPSDMGPQ